MSSSLDQTLSQRQEYPNQAVYELAPVVAASMKRLCDLLGNPGLTTYGPLKDHPEVPILLGMLPTMKVLAADIEHLSGLCTEATKEAAATMKELPLIKQVIEHYLPGEEADWAATGQPEDHIVHTLRALQKANA